MTDHDRLFKELLTTFFFEFVDLFLPDVSAFLDPNSIEFLDKEVFTDVTSGDKHEVDIVVKARYRDKDTFFILHVENQAKPQQDFPRRMFRYFSRLHDKFALPVYPIVVFSYDAPQRPEPSRYRIVFPNKRVLDFQYTVIQLNRLPWRRFVHQPNPIASALMAKMKIAPKDRPKVKLECLRLLATLKLTPAKARLIAGFVESYLRLTASERQSFERGMAALAPEEKEPIMELTNSWIERGKEEGSKEEATTLVLRQLRRRFGELPAAFPQRLTELSRPQLEELAEDLIDFASLSDADNWLSRIPS